jgi:4,5:9,10-diseco-3-hydroxy-5,9,17-trioxoandrosta-1(10),2-diene-4-oate hydrolase
LQERRTDVDGLPTRYLTAGDDGPPLVLLHGVGDNALDWRWVTPALARSRRVYAPDLPGAGESAEPEADADYSPVFFERSVAAFLDALGIARAAVVGNSLGGLAALRLALSEPDRVAALGLVAGAGLGRRVSPALRSLSLPGYGRLATAWGKTRPGAAQRALGRAGLVFASPRRVPREWLGEQYRLARLPGFLQAQLATVRAQVGLRGQREVLVDRLPDLRIPTLVLWGARDRVLPTSQAHGAIDGLENGFLEILPDCGHLPQVEQPERFASALDGFLRGSEA